MKPFHKRGKKFLQGSCAAFAIAAHDILGWPIFVLKIDDEKNLETHIVVYDVETDYAFDASGFYPLHDIKNLKGYRRISMKSLEALNELHLNRITKKDIDEACELISKYFWKKS